MSPSITSLTSAKKRAATPNSISGIVAIGKRNMVIKKTIPVLIDIGILI
jgi:hypothetical protein